MYKETIEYVDFEGTARKEDFYFNLSRAEIIEYENSELGGISKLLEKIVESEDNVRIMKMFKRFIMMSYGEKSADGRRFIKSDEAALAFTQTEAYSELLMKMFTDVDYASKFINGVVSAVPLNPDKKTVKEFIAEKSK